MRLLAIWLPLFSFGVSGVFAQEAPDFVLPPVPSTTTPHATFSAQHFEYDESSKTIHLEGHAFVKESSWTVRADQLTLYLEQKRADAFGNLQMEDGTSLAFGEAGDFDFEKKKGTLEDATAGFAPWRVHGEHARMDPDHWVSFTGADFTSCNLDVDPHYHFHSSSLHVLPHQWMYALNTIFYLRRVPVFYVPFFWKSLRRKHIFHTRVQPGYDHRNGPFVKTSTVYDLNAYTHGKFFTDYYAHKGWGVGNELDLKEGTKSNGGIYAYRIHERDTGQERWAVLGDDYQVLPATTTFQMRLQAQSDPNFNNDYLRSNSFAVTPQLINSGAFTRNTHTTITRLSYSREDDQNPLDPQKFVKTQENLPRLDWQTAPLSLDLPWLNTFTANAVNGYTQGMGFWQRSSQAAWQARKAIPLVRNLSFEPTWGFSETYESRRDWLTAVSTQSYIDAFTARYNAGGDFRWNSPAGIWDLGQTWQARFTPDTLNVDTAAQDRGVETNMTNLSYSLRPTRSIWTRVQSGYDWRVFRYQGYGFRDRVQPFSSDITWLAGAKWNLLVHDAYQLDQGNQTLAVQSDWGDRQAGTFYGLGLNNNKLTAFHFFPSEEFAIGPSTTTWRVWATLREDVRTARGGLHFDSVQLYDKELVIQKSWHDFNTRATFRIRPGGVKEAQFRIELRLDTKRPVGPSPPESTPWRTWKSED